LTVAANEQCMLSVSGMYSYQVTMPLDLCENINHMLFVIVLQTILHY